MTTKKRPTLKFSTGEAVKAVRLKRNENQAEFWSRIGVTQSGGSRYESGRNIPKPVQLLLQVTYGTDKQADDLAAWLRGETQPNACSKADKGPLKRAP